MHSLLVVAAAAANIGGPLAAQVELVSDPAAVAEAERLGEVRSNSLMGGVLAGAAYTKVLNGVKTKAAKLGATHVHLLSSTAGYAGANMLGIAFRCSQQAVTE